MPRYFLNVPASHHEYAITHGAIFDPTTKTFYVDEDIPEALEAFSQRRPDRQTQTRQAFPRCAQCGSRMVERYSRRLDTLAWYCLRHPDEHDVLGHWIPDSFTPLGTSAKAGLYNSDAPPDKPGRSALIRVVSKAIDVLGKRHFEKWLFTPNDQLENCLPAKLLESHEGVVKVLTLLAQMAKSKIR
jgi:hypothetical protein